MRESEQGGSPEATYEGWASKDPDPEERGKKVTIEAALRHAYENAKDAGAKPPYVLVATEIHAENPITDYKVVIKPKP
jgi:hypothetical protein